MVKESRHLQNVDDTVSVDSRASNKSPSTRRKAIDDTFVDAAKLHQLDAELLPIDGVSINGATGAASAEPPANSALNAYYRLTDEEKGLVAELRNRLRDHLPKSYDTDFNLYRWLRSADRTSRQHGNVDLAEKLLSNHLRFRKALKLDDINIPSWDDNPMFARRYLPRGFLYYMASNNRFLWWVDYSSIDMAGIMNTVTSTDMLVWHFLKYEHMLRLVNECERRTNALSGVHMVMDVERYDMNPFSLMMTTNGGMTYYAQLIHYEHYPELTCPVNIINVAKWLMLPYRLIRSVMPKDFNERIRVSDSNYRQALLQDIAEDELPTALGGRNEKSKELETVQAEKLDPNDYYSHRHHEEDPTLDQVSHIQIAARKRKLIPIDCQAGSKLKWWFRTDADVYFGIFFLAEQSGDSEKRLKKDSSRNDILEKMEMVHPYFRLLTKIIPECGEHVCQRTGTYYLVFCNKGSWVYRRNIQVKIDIDESVYDRKRVLERAYSVH